jgi:hypothetical protein
MPQYAIVRLCAVGDVAFVDSSIFRIHEIIRFRGFVHFSNPRCVHSSIGVESAPFCLPADHAGPHSGQASPICLTAYARIGGHLWIAEDEERFLKTWNRLLWPPVYDGSSNQVQKDQLTKSVMTFLAPFNPEFGL